MKSRQYFFCIIITLFFVYSFTNALPFLDFFKPFTQLASRDATALLDEALGTSKNSFKAFSSEHYDTGRGYVNPFTRTIALDDTIHSTLLPFTAYHLAAHIHNKDVEKLAGATIGSLALYTGVVYKFLSDPALRKTVKKLTLPAKIVGGLIITSLGIGITYKLVNSLRWTQEHKADVWACQKLLEKKDLESLECYLSFLKLSSYSLRQTNKNKIQLLDREFNHLKSYLQQQGYTITEHSQEPKGLQQSIITIAKTTTTQAT